MKILVLPDIHGRRFWKEPCEHIDEYDKVIFLGDYLDPYEFEGISVKDAIDNFDEILDFADKHKDKVDLLLGNHDLSYYSKKYKSFSMWHCRHSHEHCDEIRERFERYKDLFKIAVTYDDILFTHAGCTPGWLMIAFSPFDFTSVEKLANDLNTLLHSTKGLKHLFMISSDRGGRDRYASCIWADVSDTMWYQEILDNPYAKNFSKSTLDVIKMKQVFGHTLQVLYQDKDGKVYYDKPIEVNNNKMLDNAKAYELDTETFTVIPVQI